MAISSLGIGSGLDVSTIISKLMQIEQQPLVQLQSKEASYQSKISALGTLQGAVSSLNTAVATLKTKSSETATTKFSTFKASVGDSSATATATTSAVAGSYAFEVKQLATTHRITTTAFSHTLESGSYATENDYISSSDGTLTITVDGTTKEVDITADTTTLSDLASSITGVGVGITATVEDDGGGGKKLVMVSNASGAAGKINITSTISGFNYDAGTETYDLTETQSASGKYASADTSIAEGTLQLTVGDGTVHEVVIDSSNATLGGLRDAVNSAKIGVTATLSTIGENDVRLVITSSTMGNNGKITMAGLAGFEFDPTDGSGDLSQEASNGGQVAQSAIIKLNGITVTNDSNTITDAIQGVTLSLAKVSTSASTLSVTQEKSSALIANFTSIVKAYNDLNTAMRSLGNYDAETKKGGPLLGNSTLRTVSSSIRNLFQSSVEGTSNSSYKRLSDLGLEIQKDGSIVFNSSKLTTATNANFEAVANLAATFGSAAKKLTDGMLGTKGSITAATDGAKASVKDLEKRAETLSSRLTQIEARYKKQYAALDSLIAGMNQTSSYLTQQLANLPSASSN